MTPIVVDDLLPTGYADDIEYDLVRTGFKWLYVKDVTNKNYGSNSGFVHPAYDYGKDPSDWFPYIKPLTYSLEEAQKEKITELYRIRVGFLLPTTEPDYKYNTPHVDFLWGHRTACYYVNDSDGPTHIFKQRLEEIGSDVNDVTLRNYTDRTNFEIMQSVEPKKNRVCIFDGFNFHASTKPKTHERRLVITINYK